MRTEDICNLCNLGYFDYMKKRTSRGEYKIKEPLKVIAAKFKGEILFSNDGGADYGHPFEDLTKY